MPSITRSLRPVPKLRVTRRSCGAAWPQAAQTALCGIDRDDVEDAREADFDDGLCFAAIERALSGLDMGKVLGLVLNGAGEGTADGYGNDGYGYIAG